MTRNAKIALAVTVALLLLFGLLVLAVLPGDEVEVESGPAVLLGRSRAHAERHFGAFLLSVG